MKPLSASRLNRLLASQPGWTPAYGIALLVVTATLLASRSIFLSSVIGVLVLLTGAQARARTPRQSGQTDLEWFRSLAAPLTRSFVPRLAALLVLQLLPLSKVLSVLLLAYCGMRLHRQLTRQAQSSRLLLRNNKD